MNSHVFRDVRNMRVTVARNCRCRDVEERLLTSDVEEENGNHVSRKTSHYAKKCNIEVTTVTGRIFDGPAISGNALSALPSYPLTFINVHFYARENKP